jgi:hypothetical protein
MVDIDEDVVGFCKEHLPENEAAFKDQRLELVIDDAMVNAPLPLPYTCPPRIIIPPSPPSKHPNETPFPQRASHISRIKGWSWSSMMLWYGTAQLYPSILPAPAPAPAHGLTPYEGSEAGAGDRW